MLMVERTGEQLAARIVKAETFSQRLIGLMGKLSMSSREALIIDPCNQVHTFFVFFPIDLLFIDENNVVIKQVKSIPPFRISPKVKSAQRVVELKGGTLKKLDIVEGDRLLIRPGSR